MRICVYGCRGKDGESEPYVFHLGTRRLQVIAILDRWRDGAHCFFEVRADDGRCFLLQRAAHSEVWQLAGCYRTPRGARPRVAALPPAP